MTCCLKRLERILSHLTTTKTHQFSMSQQQRSPITCHILDNVLGQPAKDVPIQLEYYKEEENQWILLSTSITDKNGRCNQLLNQSIEPGRYRITFDTNTYYKEKGEKCFYPFIQVVFDIKNTNEHYHIPLLLSPFGYTTYRGS
jgi:5-hydroxyisourate hydrolase